jgi:hypothetical protein
MTQIKMPGESPVVDFDYFRFSETAYNYNHARDLAVLLMAHVNIDDLHGFNDEEGVYFPSTVGTGGAGMNMPTTNRGAQQSCLASHFSSYYQRQYQSCYLGLPEYQCLRELLVYLNDDYNPAPHRNNIHTKNIELLSETCRQFELAYVKEDPGFLFNLIKSS